MDNEKYSVEKLQKLRGKQIEDINKQIPESKKRITIWRKQQSCSMANAEASAAAGSWEKQVKESDRSLG